MQHSHVPGADVARAASAGKHMVWWLARRMQIQWVMTRLDHVLSRQRKLFWANLVANVGLLGAVCVGLAGLL